MAITDPTDLDLICWFQGNDPSMYERDGSQKVTRIIDQGGDPNTDLVRYLGAGGKVIISANELNGNKGYAVDAPGQDCGIAPAAVLNWTNITTELNVFILVGQMDPFENQPGLFMNANFTHHGVKPFDWNWDDKIRTNMGSTVNIGKSVDDGVYSLLHVQSKAAEQIINQWRMPDVPVQTTNFASAVTYPIPDNYGACLFGANHVGANSWGGTVYCVIVARAMTAQQILETKDWVYQTFSGAPPPPTNNPVDPANKITCPGGISDPLSLFAGLAAGTVVSWTTPSTGVVANVTVDANGYPIFSNADSFGTAVFQYNWETSDGAGDWNEAGTYTAELTVTDPAEAPDYGDRSNFENANVTVDLSAGWSNIDTDVEGELVADALPGACVMDKHGVVTGSVGATGQSVAVTVTYNATNSSPAKPPISAEPFTWEVIDAPPPGDVSGASRLGLKQSISIS